VQYAPSLIPLKLQCEYAVPCASPQGIQDEHARVAAALFSAAPEITASYSGRLSPFAAPYAGHSASIPARWEGRLAREWFGGVTLEEFSDGTAPAYQAGGEVRGGTGILKSQSLCPFRAFAEYRLEAGGPNDACFGFDPMQRGGFLHKALELAWGRLRTQAQLLSLSDDGLQILAREVAAEAVDANGGDPFHRQTAQVERERLRDLLLEWLNTVEKTRTQPFAVEMVEQERYFELGGLGLRLRVDRIDRLDNGKLLLIDYKSGETSRSSLDDERPGEPQLLIYAAALGREVDGLFFGQLKPRCLKLVGYSREQHVPGRAMGVLREKWDGFLDSSYEHLQRIAQEFVEGHMAVRPAKGACVYCKMKPLCRVRESQGLTGDFDTEA
jgi:ATP-dependent helicase/nuclease subunit B